ncbi:MAG: hypothetical protein QW728_05055 [Thermoplasmata archaeon]
MGLFEEEKERQRFIEILKILGSRGVNLHSSNMMFECPDVYKKGLYIFKDWKRAVEAAGFDYTSFRPVEDSFPLNKKPADSRNTLEMLEKEVAKQELLLAERGGKKPKPKRKPAQVEKGLPVQKISKNVNTVRTSGEISDTPAGAAAGEDGAELEADSRDTGILQQESSGETPDSQLKASQVSSSVKTAEEGTAYKTSEQEQEREYGLKLSLASVPSLDDSSDEMQIDFGNLPKIIMSIKKRRGRPPVIPTEEPPYSERNTWILWKLLKMLKNDNITVEFLLEYDRAFSDSITDAFGSLWQAVKAAGFELNFYLGNESHEIEPRDIYLIARGVAQSGKADEIMRMRPDIAMAIKAMFSTLERALDPRIDIFDYTSSKKKSDGPSLAEIANLTTERAKFLARDDISPVFAVKVRPKFELSTARVLVKMAETSGIPMFFTYIPRGIQGYFFVQMPEAYLPRLKNLAAGIKYITYIVDKPLTKEEAVSFRGQSSTAGFKTGDCVTVVEGHMSGSVGKILEVNEKKNEVLVEFEDDRVKMKLFLGKDQVRQT